MYTLLEYLIVGILLIYGLKSLDFVIPNPIKLGHIVFWPFLSFDINY
jgi:hypothetical protein